MKKSVVVAAAALAALVGGVSVAAADNETATINYNVKGSFSPKKFKPAKLSWGLNLSAPTTSPIVLPMKLAKQTFPTNKVMQFVPAKGLPVCKATSAALSAAPEVVLRDSGCANSLIGNGNANFRLLQINRDDAFRNGTVLIFYGGKVGKNVKIRFSAYSYDTGAAVYAEGILKPDGKMDIAMPQLTGDSSVTMLQLAIPSTRFQTTWPVKNSSGVQTGSVNVDLPAGVPKAKTFVQVKCRMGQKLNFASTFELGKRNTAGVPTGPTTTISAKSSSKCGK